VVRALEEAFRYALELHAKQVRTDTSIPYVSHPLAVCSLVLEAGGDEEQAIAALLHDAAEDHGGRKRLDHIRANFGERVAHIVEGCSDTLDEPKPPWRQRKEAYLRHLERADDDVVLVSTADKLHNARSILMDYREEAENVWRRFDAGRDYGSWYLPALAATLARRSDTLLTRELRRVVDELAQLMKKK
jgi:(p)ppGpp synthase/HD superfamily hydrolase